MNPPRIVFVQTPEQTLCHTAMDLVFSVPHFQYLYQDFVLYLLLYCHHRKSLLANRHNRQNMYPKTQFFLQIETFVLRNCENNSITMSKLCYICVLLTIFVCYLCFYIARYTPFMLYTTQHFLRVFIM